MGPLRGNTVRWEQNVEMHRTELGRKDAEWISLAQDRDKWRAHLNTAVRLRIP